MEQAMSTMNESSTVGDWVAHHPTSARIFDKFRIDYCCGGSVSLIDACKTRNLDWHSILEELRSIPAIESSTGVVDWTTRSLTELCDHLEQTHHDFLRRELPRLELLIAKVATVHGERNPKLHEFEKAFHSLRGELEPHLLKEEQILFPAVRLLEESAITPRFHFGAITNPISMMEREHDVAGSLLARIRDLLNDFQPPIDACNSFRAMLEGLEELEIDLHAHIHKENHILFPRATNLDRGIRP
jgi:regulator of cell morphogenesis and NO signaling